jgi:hypothetical protein
MSLKRVKQYLYNLLFRVHFFRPSADGLGPIFIIGTGRSGTHFLCSCLNSFPSLDDGFEGRESKYIFDFLSELTVRDRPMPKNVIGYYHYMKRRVYPNALVDQTHPNIWHVETLIKNFPNAKFIALSRNVYSVVYSMKNHKGVAAWERNHMEYPKPNRFLGVTKNNEYIYSDKLTDIQRFVFRWCSHEDRICELADRFPGHILRLSYEDLARNMEEEMERIADFISVNPSETFAEFNEVSLYKKDSLVRNEREEIDSALKMYYKDELFGE